MLISGQNFDSRLLSAADEATVLTQLTALRQFVAETVGDKIVFTLTFDVNEIATKEIARRLQDLNPAWKITGMVSARNITLERRTTSVDLDPENAGSFYIDVTRQQTLVENGTAIEGVIATVQEFINARGRTADEFCVSLPRTISFYVLERAAERMDYYSNNFAVTADSDTHAIIGKPCA